MPPRAVGRTHLTILLVYLLLAVLFTWPTITHPATHLPGDGGDDPAIAWNLWWVKHALLTLGTNPLSSDVMFYPIGVNLAFYTLTVLNALTAMPLTLTLGVVWASNLHLCFSMLAGGYGAFLLARHVLATPARPGSGGYASIGASAVVGGFYAFASSQLFYVSLGQFNIASSHWVPYAVLFALKSRRDLKSLRWPVLAALFLVLQVWAEMTYASFLLVFFGLFVVYETVTNIKSQTPALRASARVAGRGSRTTHHASQFPDAWLAARNLLITAVLFTLGISPLLAAMLPDMQAEGDFWVQGSGFAEAFSADLAGFLVPTMRHPMLGDLVGKTGILNFDKGQHIYLGFTLLVLAVVGVMGRNRAAPASAPFFWVLSALLFAWLALGPTIYLSGRDTGVPGPFLLLQWLPFFKGNRYPSRYSVMLVLSLAMLAAMGIRVVCQRVYGQKTGRDRETVPVTLALCCLFFALFAFEHLALPLPQSDMRVPDPYHELAREPAPFTVFDIPVAWRNGFRITGPIHPGFMFGQFYQTVHNRPLLQGNTSRNPEFQFQYFTQAPVINSILALETGHSLPPERWEGDRAVAGDVLRFFDIQYVVVRPGPGTDPTVTPEATLPYIEAVMPVELVSRSPAITVFRVRMPPIPERLELGPAAPLARLYFAEGWGALVDQSADEAGRWMWAQRRRVRLFAPLDGASQQVAFRLFVPGEGQSITLVTDTWRSKSLPLHPGWGEYELSLPDTGTQAGLNEINLHFERLYPVTTLGGSPAILVQSAGQEVGDFGHVYVDGVHVSLNQRGYNLVVLSPQGDIQAASFDTHLDPSASQALAEFVAGVPDGHTLAVAAADEASMNLGEEGVVALRSIGVAGDLRGKFRWSHAFMGVKGAESGAALEAMDGLRPVSVAVGPPLTEPAVAAAIEWIRFEAVE
jgi:hypothetical protein